MWSSSVHEMFAFWLRKSAQPEESAYQVNSTNSGKNAKRRKP